jgi:hypothetical protein
MVHAICAHRGFLRKENALRALAALSGKLSATIEKICAKFFR